MKTIILYAICLTVFVASLMHAAYRKSGYMGEPVVTDVQMLDTGHYKYRISIGNGDGEGMKFWTNKWYDVGEVLSNNPYVDLPEEWNQVTADPQAPDTLYAYVQNDTLHLEFHNYRTGVSASGENVVINCKITNP